MKIETKALEGNKMEVEVECSVEQVAEALAQSYKKVVRGVSVPGFRKGKVPRQILEARYGTEVLYDDAIEILLPETYQAALEEVTFEPIDQPDVEVVTFETGQPAVFKFVIQGPPEVELGQYLGVEVEQVSFPVTDADLEQTLQEMQGQHARLVESPEDTIVEGDFVTLDYEGSVDGELFEGGQADEYTLEIGSNTFVPGFEEQLIGLAAGAKAAINVTFPEEYRNEELAGQAAVFDVEIKDIKRRELPALDDDFAAEISEFATLEELRADVKNKLQESATERERNVIEGRVVEAVAANAQVTVPEVFIASEIESMVDELAHNLSQQGFPEEFAREYIGGRMDEIKADYREAAESRVRTRLVLEEIKKVEAVTVTDEELDAKVQEMAVYYQQDAEEIRKKLIEQDSLEILRDNVANEKTVQLLVDAAVRVLPAPKPEQSEDAAE